MQQSKYAYIVAADIRYLPELVANLNSLDYVGNTFDVHIIGYKIPEDVQEQFKKLSYNTFYHVVSEQEIEESYGLSEVVCRKRYWYAAVYGEHYDAICILDADLVWVRNPFQYFEIAAKTGFILGPCKEQNKVYDDPHHTFNGEFILEKGYYNAKDMCNCPVFLDAKLYEEPLKQSWLWFHTGFREGTNMKCPDMDCMNIAFVKYAGPDKLIAMPGIQWLGTNEQMLKPYIRACEDRGVIKTESGIQIMCYHGQFWHKNWRMNQVNNRHNCAIGYLKADKHPEVIGGLDNQAAGAMNCLYEYFQKMVNYKIQIEKKNYRHPELPYEE